MKFAKIVFWIAGLLGFLIISPLYFLFDLIGRNDPPPITHPGFFYGFVGLALAWQIVFCIVATDPVRYRPLMLPSIVEKFAYAMPMVLLISSHRAHPSDLPFALIDLTLAALFIAAYLKTSGHPASPSRESPK